jgi:hypothetical protein
MLEAMVDEVVLSDREIDLPARPGFPAGKGRDTFVVRFDDYDAAWMTEEGTLCLRGALDHVERHCRGVVHEFGVVHSTQLREVLAAEELRAEPPKRAAPRTPSLLGQALARFAPPGKGEPP